MTPARRNRLFMISCIVWAALASMVACFALLVASKEENASIAAGAFAVAGLISLMPWQLAQAWPAETPDDKKRNALLIQLGAWMCIASILFVSGAVLRHYYFHGADLVALGPWPGWLLRQMARFFSAIAFLVASMYFSLGVSIFAGFLMEVTDTEKESPVVPPQSEDGEGGRVDNAGG